MQLCESLHFTPMALALLIQVDFQKSGRPAYQGVTLGRLLVGLGSRVDSLPGFCVHSTHVVRPFLCDSP